MIILLVLSITMVIIGLAVAVDIGSNIVVEHRHQRPIRPQRYVGVHRRVNHWHF